MRCARITLACVVILTITAMFCTSATAGDTRLGEQLFRKNWTALAEPDSADRRRVGPLFNAGSCQICHNDGLGGHAPSDSGPAPAALVIQLEARLRHAGADPEGNPVYGRVLNTQASPGSVPEGRVVVSRFRNRPSPARPLPAPLPGTGSMASGFWDDSAGKAPPLPYAFKQRPRLRARWESPLRITRRMTAPG
jgi:hypothetical protein